MTRSPAEIREYGRGYNRAMARCRDRVERVLRIARGYKEKADEAIYHDTMPRCVSCQRWTRGDQNCMWGYCGAGFEYAAGEHGMWADTFVGEKDQRRVITQEMFGCVNWVAPVQLGTGSESATGLAQCDTSPPAREHSGEP